MAFLACFALVLAFQPIFISRLQKIGVRGQPIREDGPEAHLAKSGTPTMGGVVIAASVLLIGFLLADIANPYVWMVLSIMLGFAAVGFVDDWKKIREQNSVGLTGPLRLLIEFSLAILIVTILVLFGFSTEIQLPFLKDLSFNLGWWFFIPFAAVVIVGTANAVNITDGLDGLAIGPIMTVAALYAVFAYVTGHAEIARYLGINYVAGMGEVSIILAAVVAAGLGFLWYNAFPAQVFMGDLGALAMGALLGLTAVLVKQEIILVIAGGVFVVEALSVIIQRYYYKLTKKRVFKMAPIHHHFELLGWAEPKIIVRFWIISIVLALIGLTSLKLR